MATRAGLGVSLSAADPLFLTRVLPLIDYLEVDPDVMAEYHHGQPRIQPLALELIREASRHVPVLIHGTGLSIGSHQGYSREYLRLLDELLQIVTPAWHSEHLGFVDVDGEFLGTMLTVPRTEEALDLVCERVRAIQARYALPFLLENVIRLLPDERADYSEAGFLNAIVAGTGCGLLLDLYNLECDAQNNLFDLDGFLNDLRLDAVREFHLACGEESDGLLLDVHLRETRACTVALARRVAARAPSLQCVNFELLKDGLLWMGIEGLEEELRRLRRELLS